MRTASLLRTPSREDWRSGFSLMARRTQSSQVRTVPGVWGAGAGVDGGGTARAGGPPKVSMNPIAATRQIVINLLKRANTIGFLRNVGGKQASFLRVGNGKKVAL